MSGNDWVKTLRRFLQHVDKWKPQDRLSYVSAICALNNMIIDSCAGWVERLENPQVMEDFTEAELKQIFIFFRKICKEFAEANLTYMR